MSIRSIYFCCCWFSRFVLLGATFILHFNKWTAFTELRCTESTAPTTTHAHSLMWTQVQVLQWPMFSHHTFNKLQKCHLVPAVVETWQTQQSAMLSDIVGRHLVVGGGGRCHSPDFWLSSVAVTLQWTCSDRGWLTYSLCRYLKLQLLCSYNHYYHTIIQYLYSNNSQLKIIMHGWRHSMSTTDSRHHNMVWRLLRMADGQCGQHLNVLPRDVAMGTYKGVTDDHCKVRHDSWWMH